MKIIRTIANIALGIGCLAFFNESGNFMPNLFGLACAALLVFINRDKSDYYNEQKR